MLEAPAYAGSVSGNSSPISPRPAAPSRASMSACAATSASEWPASPSVWSTRTPQRTSSRPGANRCASYPPPTLDVGLDLPREQRPREREVLRRGDLDVRGSGRHQTHRIPATLQQHGVVGGAVEVAAGVHVAQGG